MNSSRFDPFEVDGPGITLRSHLDSPLPPEAMQPLLRPHRSPNYFLMFVNRGSVRYSIDLEEVSVSEGQVLFIKPHQVRIPPGEKGSAEYFKVTFDQQAHAMLPRTCRFWLDPLKRQKVMFSTSAWGRMHDALALLRVSLRTAAATSLKIAYLHAVLQELEEAYFADVSAGFKQKNVQAFLDFQSLIEDTFTKRLSIAGIAGMLGMGETSLYNLVKKWSSVSPKEYVNRRIALEAQRLLLYSGLSVKELADHLGFTDENYLSRFFRKQTGHSISDFLAHFEELSR